MDNFKEMGRDIDVAREINEGSLTATRILVIALCVLVSVVEGFDQQAMGFVAPAVAQEWGLKVSDLNGVFAVNILGLIIGGFVAGTIGDRFGRKAGQLAGICIAGLSMIGCAYSTSIHELTLWRCLTGIGIGITTPNAAALTTEFAPARLRTMLVAAVISGFAIGGVIGGAVCAAVIETHGWRAVLLGGGIVSMAVVPLIVFLGEESPLFLARRDPASRKAARLLAKLVPGYCPQSGDRLVLPPKETKQRVGLGALFAEQRAVGTLLLWVLLSINLAAMFCMITWLPTILHMSGFTMSHAIVGGTMFAATGLVAGLAEAALVDRHGPRVIVTACYMCAALALSAIALGTGAPQWFTLTMVCIVGATIGGPIHVLWAMAAEFYPAAVRSTGVGVAAGIGRMGIMAGVVMTGLLLNSQDGIMLAFLVLAATALVAAVAAWTFNTRQMRRDDTATAETRRRRTALAKS